MKFLVSIFLNLVFSASTLFSAYVVADYFLRYDYYSKVLCINKDKPQMQCNGTCHLATDNQQDTSTDVPMTEIEVFEFLAIPANQAERNEPIVLQSEKSRFARNQQLFPLGHVFKILRPPEFIV
jgi:hypothetical protein